MYWRRDELKLPMKMRLLLNPIFDNIYQTTEIITMYDGSVTEQNTLQGFRELQVRVVDKFNSSLLFLFVNAIRIV